MIEKSEAEEILRVADSGYLFHREGQELEFIEQYNFSSLADYFRDFAAFSNNKGGYLVFGIQDSPRVPNGLSASALDQFSKIDPEKITGYLLNIFSGNINWEQAEFEIDSKHFGVFRIYSAKTKPIIAKKGEFDEKKGATTLKLVGDLMPIDHIEVIKKVKEDLIKRFPYSAIELAKEVKRLVPSSSQSDVWKVISENDLKNNFDYSAYNFRNKQKEDDYKKTGNKPGCPSIYNQNAIEFVANLAKQIDK